MQLTYYGNPVLRKKCAPIEKVTEAHREIAQKMLETMHVANGIGLAGPQVNYPYRIFITCVPIPGEEDTWLPGTPRAFINPTILSVSDETDVKSEGCLSIPEIYGDVERPIRVTIEATDLEGNLFTETFEGLEARCVLHENDHINGKLFIDRMSKEERKEIDPLLQELKKKLKENN